MNGDSATGHWVQTQPMFAGNESTDERLQEKTAQETSRTGKRPQEQSSSQNVGEIAAPLKKYRRDMKPSEKAADDKHREYEKSRRDFKDLKNALKKSARTFVSEARAINSLSLSLCLSLSLSLSLSI